MSIAYVYAFFHVKLETEETGGIRDSDLNSTLWIPEYPEYFWVSIQLSQRIIWKRINWLEWADLG